MGGSGERLGLLSRRQGASRAREEGWTAELGCAEVLGLMPGCMGRGTRGSFGRTPGPEIGSRTLERLLHAGRKVKELPSPAASLVRVRTLQHLADPSMGTSRGQPRWELAEVL